MKPDPTHPTTICIDTNSEPGNEFESFIPRVEDFKRFDLTNQRDAHNSPYDESPEEDETDLRPIITESGVVVKRVQADLY